MCFVPWVALLLLCLPKAADDSNCGADTPVGNADSASLAE